MLLLDPGANSGDSVVWSVRWKTSSGDMFLRILPMLEYAGVFQRGTAGLISLETSCRSLLVFGQSGYFIIETYLFLSNAGLTVRPYTVVSGTATCVRRRARKRSTA